MRKLIEAMFRKEGESATADFRNHIRQVRSRVQPLRIELVASPDTSWLDTTVSRPVVELLLQLGFQRAGVVAVKGNDRAVIAGFACSQHSVLASVPKGSDRVFLSFVSHFTDGSAFECSNMPVPFEPPCPEWLVRRRRTGASPQDLWSAFLAERPSKPMQAATPESFATSNAEDFFQYQTWMAERGGATREELETRYRAIGKLPTGEDAKGFLDMARHDEADRALCNWWRLQSDAPCPLEQVMDSLIIIHDDLPSNLLINAYWCGTNDFKAKDTDFAGAPPRDAFARLVASRGSPIRKVFEKRTALKADFYLPKEIVTRTTNSPPTAQDAARRLVILKHVLATALAAPPQKMLQKMRAGWSAEDRDKFERQAEAQRDQFWRGLHDAGLWQHLSPREQALAQSTMNNMTEQQQVEASWRMEAAQTLMWALNMIRELPPYDKMADHELLKQIPSRGVAAFIQPACLREQAELERARDTAEFWHWRSRTRELIERGDPFPDDASMRDAGFHSYDDIVRFSARNAAQKRTIPPCIEDDFPAQGKAYRDLTDGEWSQVRSITVERHFTLNWLCGYAPANNWDETPTDT
jgi:hypothetical protein